jgi:hypothetical protein
VRRVESGRCDEVFGLFQGQSLFIGPNLTVAPTTAATSGAATSGGAEAWVIVVAVVVPVVVLLGVAIALLVVFLHRRGSLRYDKSVNAELRDRQMQVMRTNNNDY